MHSVKKPKHDWVEIVTVTLILLLAALILIGGIYKEWLQFQVMLKYLRGQ